jgi:hypothetical protein
LLLESQGHHCKQETLFLHQRVTRNVQMILTVRDCRAKGLFELGRIMQKIWAFNTAGSTGVNTCCFVHPTSCFKFSSMFFIWSDSGTNKSGMQLLYLLQQHWDLHWESQFCSFTCLKRKH